MQLAISFTLLYFNEIFVLAFNAHKIFCQNHSGVVVWKRANKLCQLDIFPAIKILLSILATLAVSSATAER